MKAAADFTDKLRKIKLVVTDVDGVLTDGGLYYTGEGMVMKKFNVKDGMGSRRLQREGILVGIISTDVSQIIQTRAERLKLDFVYTGIWEKDEILKQLCEEKNIKLEETAFIGDDINDSGIIEIAGFTVAPADAMDEVKERVDLVMTRKGGDAVFREFAEMILNCIEQEKK